MNCKEQAKNIYNFTKKVIDSVGARLPGSVEEAEAVKIIASEMEDVTGNKAIIEPFYLSPRSSIGSIPVLGIVGFIAMFSFYLSPIACAVIALLTLMFAVLQIFSYSGIFDAFFTKTKSHNVYSVIDPPIGDIKYTLVYSGHNDSSWNWNHSVTNPHTMIIKTALGVTGIVFLCVLGIVTSAMGYLSYKDIIGSHPANAIVLYCLPLLTIVTNFWLAYFLDWDKKNASPGAMDNLTGVGLSIEMGRYYKQNPDKHPLNARIIIMGLGAEEAGLKGSFDFAERHCVKDDTLLINPYVINLDSFKDYDNFNVVKGDLWLFSRFDKDMRKIALQTMIDNDCNPSEIVNPIGGCDSTPFHRKGIPTVTLCAQNPTATDYYHTCYDHYNYLDMRTLEKACAVTIDFTERLSAKIQNELKIEN